MDNWTKTFFGKLYGEIYRDYLMEPERAYEEVSFLSHTLDLGRRTVLDLACGFGRHSRLLAVSNRVVGIDNNSTYLAMGLENLKPQHRKNYLPVSGDMRQIPCQNASFHAGICLFNSFGYFSDEDNASVLKEIYRVLKPGADFLLEIPNKRLLLEAVAENPNKIMVSQNAEIHEEFHWNLRDNRLENKTTFRLKDEEESGGYRLRLYDPTEIKGIIEEAGFRIIKNYGDYEGDRFRPAESDSLLIHFRRPARVHKKK